jgi:hypothetical protein
MRGSSWTLCHGGGRVVAHSGELANPHGSSAWTCRHGLTGHLGEPAAEAHVDRAREVCGGEVLRIAGVEQHGAAADQVVGLRQRQRRDPRGLVEHRPGLAAALRGVRDVHRRHRPALGHGGDEGAVVHRLK